MLDYLNGLRWPRVATMVITILLHMGFLAFLLLPPLALMRVPPRGSLVAPSVLIIRLRIEPPNLAHPEPLHSKPTMRALAANYRPVTQKVVVSSKVNANLSAARIHRLPLKTGLWSRSVFSPGFTRSSSLEYSHQNIRIPGNSQTVNGVPRFRMVDPQSQGVAGAIRVVGGLFGGSINPHCLDVDVWRGMTQKERLASHLDISNEKIEAIADRYNCVSPLKPGDPMYYRHH